MNARLHSGLGLDGVDLDVMTSVFLACNCLALCLLLYTYFASVKKKMLAGTSLGKLRKRESGVEMRERKTETQTQAQADVQQERELSKAEEDPASDSEAASQIA